LEVSECKVKFGKRVERSWVGTGGYFGSRGKWKSEGGVGP